jgi:glycerol-3-phosphate dehydrogenase
MSTGKDAPHVVVIGGGATGCGVARDLLLRGIKVTLVEYGDLGCGTSSRFHGMLQSGARYAVSDTAYAAECMRERLALAALVPEAVEQTGGLFVSLPEDPQDYADRFHSGCKEAHIPVAEVDPEKVMAEEPLVSRRIQRAFTVPDATVQPWRLLNRIADDIRQYGGRILLRHKVTAIDHTGGKVRSVTVNSAQGTETLEADVVVNSGGPWCGEIARLMGQDVPLELTKGSIIVFAHRLVSRAVNRCRPPSSHDIIVPTGTISLFGTTSEVVDDPSDTRVHPHEIQELLDGVEPLVPGARRFRALRAWAGVRPIVKPDSWPQGQPLPRRHKILDHGVEGLDGAYTVCGGSWTTHRSMGEDTGNHVAAYFGINIPGSSATTPLLGSSTGKNWSPQATYEAIEAGKTRDRQLCECEGVDREAIARLLEQGVGARFHDLRRRLRLGFGPCQGTFCGSRLAALVAEINGSDDVVAELVDFWSERLKGSTRTAWGQQARQVMLSDLVFRENLGLELSDETAPRDHER